MIDYRIIVPVYCNETSLEILFKEVEEKIFNKNPNFNGKIVFCDDRSTDNSYSVLKELHSKTNWFNQVLKKLLGKLMKYSVVLKNMTLVFSILSQIFKIIRVN